jgi:hypothetical protein
LTELQFFRLIVLADILLLFVVELFEKLIILLIKAVNISLNLLVDLVNNLFSSLFRILSCYN